LLHLLPTAPLAVIEASYRALARLHHPDAGGNAEHMKLLNAARDALKERVSA
jgi:curved DNA-binding protein CbpA